VNVLVLDAATAAAVAVDMLDVAARTIVQKQTAVATFTWGTAPCLGELMDAHEDQVGDKAVCTTMAMIAMDTALHHHSTMRLYPSAAAGSTW